MSFSAGQSRPLARSGWGGRAASHFRGALSFASPNLSGLPIEDPQVLAPTWRGQVGTIIYRSIGALANFSLQGVSRDSTGAILGACLIDLMSTATDSLVLKTVSDASTGAFRFDIVATGPFYIVAYKAGSPDVAGTTVNTLIPT